MGTQPCGYPRVVSCAPNNTRESSCTSNNNLVVTYTQNSTGVGSCTQNITSGDSCTPNITGLGNWTPNNLRELYLNQHAKGLLYLKRDACELLCLRNVLQINEFPRLRDEEASRYCRAECNWNCSWLTGPWNLDVVTTLTYRGGMHTPSPPGM